MKGYFARKPITLDDLKTAKKHGDEAEIQVVAEVTLPKAAFETFAENLYEDYDFIAKHTQNTGVVDGTFRCILVRKAGTKRTAIAVESDGYDYARYAALVRI